MGRQIPVWAVYSRNQSILTNGWSRANPKEWRSSAKEKRIILGLFGHIQKLGRESNRKLIKHGCLDAANVLLIIYMQVICFGSTLSDVCITLQSCGKEIVPKVYIISHWIK